MPNLNNIFAAVILLMTGWCWNLQAADGSAALALFQQSCIKCHGKDGKVKGELNLLNIKTAAQLSEDLERLQTILEVLDTSEMPPEKEPPLKPETRAAAVADLQKLLRAATAEAGLAPTPIRRINRLQYNNAVQDLLGLKVSVFPLPEKMMRDRSGYFTKALGPQKKMPDTCHGEQSAAGQVWPHRAAAGGGGAIPAGPARGAWVR